MLINGVQHKQQMTADAFAFADTRGVMHLGTPGILSNEFIVLLTESQTNSSVIITSLCISAEK